MQDSVPQGRSHGRAWWKNSGIELEVIDLGIIIHVVQGKWKMTSGVHAPSIYCACANKKRKAKGGFEPWPFALRVNVLPTVLTMLRCWERWIDQPVVVHFQGLHSVKVLEDYSYISKTKCPRTILCVYTTTFRQITHKKPGTCTRMDSSACRSRGQLRTSFWRQNVQILCGKNSGKVGMNSVSFFFR